MARQRFALSLSIALAMSGVGIILPVVPSYIERLGLTNLGLERSAKSLRQIAGAALAGVLFGSSVAVPFWLASGFLLGLAPIFAWSGRHTHEPPSGRAAKGKLAFRRREPR